MKEAHVVCAEDAGNEGSDVSFSDGLLLVRLKHLDGDSIDEGRFSTIDFASLVKEVLECRVRLTVFGVAPTYYLLDLREACFRCCVDELCCLYVVSL